jgi:hypothetical protein
VIKLLNDYFVNINITNERFVVGGDATPEEKDARARIMREVFLAGQNSPVRASDAALYILDEKGKIVDALKLPECLNNDKVVELLEKCRQKLNVAAGPPIVEPRPQSVAPKADPRDLILHLTARYIPGGGTWKQLPSEDWIVLKPKEWSKLLPAADAKLNDSWNIDNELVVKILSNVYPPTSNRDPSQNTIEKPAMKATVVSQANGSMRIRLDSNLRMKHRFLPVKDDDNYVDAQLVGYVDVDLTAKKIRSVRLVTENGTYAKDNFAVAIRDVQAK